MRDYMGAQSIVIIIPQSIQTFPLRVTNAGNYKLWHCA